MNIICQTYTLGYTGKVASLGPRLKIVFSLLFNEKIIRNSNKIIFMLKKLTRIC